MDLNTEAIDDFIRFGVCFEPFDRRLPSTPALQKFDHKAEGRGLLEELSQSLHEIIASGRVGAFALSGGFDTRLVLALLLRNHSSFLKTNYIYTRVHPRLGIDKDRDAILAKMLANRFGFELQFEIPDVASPYYLLPRSGVDKAVLSGLWGGELLGGQLLTVAPFKLNALLEDHGNSKAAAIARSLRRSNGELEAGFTLISQSTLSATYQSPAWLNPARALEFCETPFLGKSFLSTLFSMDSEGFRDYKIYRELFKAEFPEMFEVPFANVFAPELGLEQVGIDPKSLPREMSAAVELNPFQEQVSEYLKRRRTEQYSEYLLSVIHLI